MGTETACGTGYYGEPTVGPGAAAMNGYYQMSSEEGGNPRSGSMTDDELAQVAVSNSDCDTDMELHQISQQNGGHHEQSSGTNPRPHHPTQQQQQQHLQSAQQHHPGDTSGRTNPWAQQLQNHIAPHNNPAPSTPNNGSSVGATGSNAPSATTGTGSNRSGSLTGGNGWSSFPGYQRLYNENSYNIAIAAAAAAASSQSQHNGAQQQQQQQQQHQHQHGQHPQHSQHVLPGPSQHHGPSQQQLLHQNIQQQQQQQQQAHQQSMAQSQQQQQQQQQHPLPAQHNNSSSGLTAAAVAAAAAAGQLGKRFYYQGKTSNSKDICGEDKHKEEGDPWNVDAHSAFLGPNLWDKTLPYDSDLKVHQVSEYADLDEFLSENGIPYDGLPSSHLGNSTSLTSQRSDSLGHCAGLSLSGLSQVTTKRERSPSPSDCMSPETMNPPSPADSTFSMSSTRDFDPRTRAFSDEELKPQPMIKKSRKQFVPDEMKDDKYWARRRKNNMAAKRSRDARRMKENQIALRAGYLEKENMNLHREVEQLKQENMELRARLSKYQEV
ncbi:protein giant-like isoform X3 [Anopheles albimanus]|uniref:protein giant-like isoform X3 n=1 Tax=Anopheles albimanus TaxID=7167 RepID=UPI00164002C3|nr:protein giant-like isoform X3 [Anopheles albimanus]